MLSQKLEDKVSDCLARFDRSTFDVILWEVLKSAAEHWVGLDEDDFCVQAAFGECLVFGGTNRLIWSPRRGFYPDKSYCTERFIERCRQLRERS